MSIRTMQQGLQAMKDGNLDEAGRLFRIALLDTTLTASMRAMIYVSLAETDPNPTFKMQCYNEALALDPNNTQARQRLEALMASTLPGTTPPPAQPVIVTPLTTPSEAAAPTLMSPPVPPGASPLTPPQTFPQTAQTDMSRQNPSFFQTVGILDGPSGMGTGFFITQDGMVATTRQVVGGLENVTVSLNGSRQMIGRVVRSYSDVDLSLVRVDITLSHILPMSTMTILADNSEISARSHQGGLIRGRVRATRRDLKPYWIPTTIRELPDIGGEPVFDERNILVGMLTRNAGRTSTDMYALHISEVMARLNDYQQALQVDPQRTYCSACGYISRAPNFHAFYCEQCGTVLPHARSTNRYPIPQMAALYGENLQPPCRICGARVGIYNGGCLRCGEYQGY